MAVRAPWSSASFLLYAGGLAVLLAVGGLFGALASDYGDGGFVALCAVVVSVLGLLAFGAKRAGRPLAAGLFAVSLVVSLAVLVGALEEWFGWLAHTDAPFEGFHVSHFLVELVLLAAAVAARRSFRFPLLVLVATATAWFFVTDLLSNGGGWSALVTLLFGLVALVVAIGSDRVYGFWVHVVAGVAIGGALVWFLHSSTIDWILVALASLAFVLIAAGLGRSSYAVLAAVGLFLATTYFVFKWFLDFTVSFFGGEVQKPSVHPWAAALFYVLYGLVLMLLGLWHAQRRRPAEPA